MNETRMESGVQVNAVGQVGSESVVINIPATELRPSDAVDFHLNSVSDYGNRFRLMFTFCRR